MKCTSPARSDRSKSHAGCSVSINACLTLPRWASQGAAHGSSGIRFECSWNSHGLSPPSPRPLRGEIETDDSSKNSSGYGSSNPSSSIVAASFTVSHAEEKRSPQPYERRCRSTCSITLQNQNQHTFSSPSTETSEFYPLRRRCSEGEAWNSHSRLSQLLAGAKNPDESVPATKSTPSGSRSSTVKTKKRERPRTVHIDVYCTASESSSDEDTLKQLITNEDDGLDTDESNESNTSSSFTVVRTTTNRANTDAKVKHTRKKNSLPHSMGRGSKLKPVLSYKISAKELAEAVERQRCRDSIGTSDAADDELFRDLTLTDSSSFLFQETESDEPEKNWRSPEEERLKLHMLEQRKQQWRAAKTYDRTNNRSMRVPSREISTSLPQNLNVDEDIERQPSNRSVTRTNTQKCPVLGKVVPATPPVETTNSNLPPNPRFLSPTSEKHSSRRHRVESPVDVPLQWRTSQTAERSLPGPLKKFGRHVGPARNPDCRCAHCVDHFARLRSSKDPRVVRP